MKDDSIYGPPQTGVAIGTDNGNDPLKVGTITIEIKRDDPLKGELINAQIAVLLKHDRHMDAHNFMGVRNRDYRKIERPYNPAYDSPPE